MEADQINNRVTSSSLVTLDLENFFIPGERVALDIKDQLYNSLVLREKDFRNYIKENDWSLYQDKFVAIHCSEDAIIPTWAFMLLSIALHPYAKKTIAGTLDDLEIVLYREQLLKIDWTSYQDAKVVIKGCSRVNVPLTIYVEATSRLKAYAASIMFGEPCSTVPLYKRPKV